MGSFEMFLLLIFFFWILEGIAKARQKPRTGETGPDAEVGPQVPADRSQRPPSLLEVIAAEMERAKQAQRQESQPRRSAEPTPPGTRTLETKEAPPPRPRVEVAKPFGAAKLAKRAALGRPTASRPPARLGARAKPRSGLASRTDPATEEQLAEVDRGERTSALWDSGLRDADRSAREVEQGAQTEAERFAALEAKRSAAVEAKRGTSLETSPRKSGLQRAAIKETQKPIEGTARKAPRQAVGLLDPHQLIGASPAELRRILVLQEVLGPPVTLRDR